LPDPGKDKYSSGTNLKFTNTGMLAVKEKTHINFIFIMPYFSFNTSVGIKLMAN